jgi:hypothetical protein
VSYLFEHEFLEVDFVRLDHGAPLKQHGSHTHQTLGLGRGREVFLLKSEFRLTLEKEMVVIKQESPYLEEKKRKIVDSPQPRTRFTLYFLRGWELNFIITIPKENSRIECVIVRI